MSNTTVCKIFHLENENNKNLANTKSNNLNIQSSLKV